MLEMQIAAGTNGLGGYSPPLVYTALDNFSLDELSPGEKSALRNDGAISFENGSILLSSDAGKEFKRIFSEEERRVYVEDRDDLTFAPNDVKSIVLPSIFKLGSLQVGGGVDTTVSLENFCNYINRIWLNWSRNKPNIIVTDKNAMKDLLVHENERYRIVKDGDPKDMNDTALTLLYKLFRLLTGKYEHVDIELVDMTGRDFVQKRADYSLERGGTSATVSIKGVSGHQRKLVAADELFPVDDEAETAHWKGHDAGSAGSRPISVIAPLATKEGLDIKSFGINPGATARLGAEVIVVGVDESGNRYVLFVHNAQQEKGFYELPGGGFYGLTGFCGFDSGDGYAGLAKQRLKFKAGIDAPPEILGLTDMKKALLLPEKDENWQYSYYRLFTAKYPGKVDSEK